MSANPKHFLKSAAPLSADAMAPYPSARKVYVPGSRPDIRVGMREIAQTPTPSSRGEEANPPVTVYDTSGPYTDPPRTSTCAPAWRRCAKNGFWNAATPRSSTGLLPNTAARASVTQARQSALRTFEKTALRQAGRERFADALCALRASSHAGDGIHRHPRDPAA